MVKIDSGLSLMKETIQMGGTLVFIVEHAPADIADWLKPLVESLLGDVPFVRRHSKDLLEGTVETRPQDLVLFWPTQKDLVFLLNGVLRGQRLLLGGSSASDLKYFVDYHWASVDVTEWQKTMRAFKLSWASLQPVREVRESFRAPGLFLDRDDVVVRNVPYNRDPEKVELMPGIEELIHRAHRQGYWVALVTNQSGLGRGMIDWQEYQRVHQRTLELLSAKGCWLDDCVWAGYVPVENTSQARLLASDRKPRVGMFQSIQSKLKVNLPSSVMVGDSATDLIAAYGVGIRHLVLLASEKTDKELSKLSEFKKLFPDFQYQSVADLKSVPLQCD